MRVVSKPGVAASGLFSVLCAAAASGQWSQYTAPGPPKRPQPIREALEKSAQEARWRWGPWKVDPEWGLSDFSYRKVDSESDQWSGAVTVGARGYLRLGESMLAAYALPALLVLDADEFETTWLERFGVGWFARLGRVELELVGRRAESRERVTLESPERFRSRGDEGRLALAFPLTSRLFWTASVATSRSEYAEEAEGLPVAQKLNRREEGVESGLSWRPTERLELRLLGRMRAVRFAEEEAAARNADVEGFGVDLSWSRPKLAVGASFEQNEVQFPDGRSRESLSGTTFRGRVFWQPRDRFGLALYGQRQWMFPVLRQEPVLVETRQGVAVDLGLGWRFRLSLFSETGDLAPLAGLGSSDPFRAEGAQLAWTIGRLGVELGYRRLEFEAADSRGYRTEEWIGNLRFGLGSVGPEF